MVGIIHDVRDIGRRILYNERKVQLGIAECLLACNTPLDAEGLTVDQKLSYLKQRCSLNANVNVSCLHAILGFHPFDNRLTNHEFCKIVKRYMELIGFGAQPFLVYRHYDTHHPHLHVISPNILSNGKQIKTYYLQMNLSYSACRVIETSYGIVPANKSFHRGQATYNSIHIPVHREDAVIKSLDQITHFLQDRYRFANLTEWNALLQCYNIRAIPQAENHKNRTPEILYYLLDERKQMASMGIKSRLVNSTSSLSNLKKIFRKNDAIDLTSLARIRTILKHLEISENSSEKELQRSLQQQGIELIKLKMNSKEPEKIVFLDHIQRCVMREEKLGLDFSVQKLLENKRNNEEILPLARKEKKIAGRNILQNF